MSGINLGKTPALIVALVIGIIMTTTAILPLASDYSEAKTFTNDGFYYMSSIDSGSTDTITIFWDHTKPTEITVNGSVIDLSGVNVESCSLVFSENWVIRYLQQSGNKAIQYYGPTGGDYVGASLSASTDLTITLNAGTATVTNTADTPVTKTQTYTKAYYVAPAGSWVMKKPTEQAYLNSNSSIMIANGLTQLGSVAYGIYFIGNVVDGLNFNTFAYYSAPTISDDNIVYTTASNYEDLVILDKVTFTLTNSSEESTTATYSYFLVPHEVTAEPDNPETYKALMKIVPLMAFIMLVVAAAAMIINKRD